MRQSCLPDWSLDGSLLLTLLLVVLHQRPVQAACPGTSAAGSSLHGGHAQHPAFMLIARHMTMQRQRPGQAASLLTAGRPMVPPKPSASWLEHRAGGVLLGSPGRLHGRGHLQMVLGQTGRQALVRQGPVDVMCLGGVAQTCSQCSCYCTELVLQTRYSTTHSSIAAAFALGRAQVLLACSHVCN